MEAHPQPGGTRVKAELRRAGELEGYVLDATDGEIGRCMDFLFDDERWVARYMVADTGTWLPKRKVLISPVSLGEPDWASKRFPVMLSKADIEGAPSIARDEPVSRRHEAALFRQHGYLPYWGGGSLWGLAAIPGHLRTQAEASVGAYEPASEPEGDPHLRSIDEVRGYEIRATDGEIGHVEDFLIDDQSWTIRYMVVDTRNWLPGRKVLISPDWVTSLDWSEGVAAVDLTRSQIQESPEYEPPKPVHRAYEAELYNSYGRPYYWH